jgi:cytochrome P450
MKTFFAAGHDTTASLIGWTLWFMSQHPEIEQKLLDEVMTVMGAASSPTYEQLAEMRYLNAVLKVGGTL